MPYKRLSDRRRRYKMRRLSDPKWLVRSRAYHRKYQKKWYRKHLAAQRKYQRKWKKKWRIQHPRVSRAYSRSWRRKNPDKVRAQQRVWYRRFGKTWYRKNRAKLRLRWRKYYRKERRLKLEQQKARRRRYYWKNRERILEKRRRLWAHNPDLFRARERKRYRRHRIRRIVSQRNIQARRAGAKGQITPQEWRRLLKRHKFRCFYCRVRLLPANRTLDHKIPLSRGGTNTIGKVVPACRPCNNRKLTMTIEEFLARQKRVKKNSIALGPG